MTNERFNLIMSEAEKTVAEQRVAIDNNDQKKFDELQSYFDFLMEELNK